MKKHKLLKLGITRGVLGAYKNMLRFSLSRKIKNNLDTLTETERKQIYELNKLKQEYALTKAKNEGLQDIEKHFFNGEPKLHQDNLTLALREEIKRLMGVITTQSEVISKTPFATSNIPYIRKPELMTSKNPLKLIKNYRKFTRELKEYEDKVLTSKKAEFHLTIEKTNEGTTIERNGSKNY